MGRQIFILTITFFLFFRGVAFLQNALQLKPGTVFFHTMIPATSTSCTVTLALLASDQKHPAPFDFEGSIHFYRKVDGKVILKI